MFLSYFKTLTFWIAILISITAVAGVPTISNLSNLTVNEQDPATIIDVDIDVTGGLAYSDGSISFSLAGALSSDTLALSSDSDVNAAGAISVTSNDVYLGNGASRDRIGSIDSTDNGQDGAALTILFSSPLVNAGFESGDTSGWTVFEQQYPDEANVNGDSIPWVRVSPAGSGTGTVLIATSTSASYTVQAVTSPVSQGTYSMQLLLTGGITCATSPAGQNPDGYCSTHGPYADSTPFEAFNGDQIFVDWAAQNGGDWYEVFGFLIGDGADDTFGTGDDTETLLFSERGDTRAFSASSANITADDTYKFRFVSGTYDASGGLGVGASLYVDGARLVGGTAISDTVVRDIARLVTFQNDSDDPPTSPRVLTVTATAQDSNSDSATANITIIAVNDDPTITSDGGNSTGAITTTQDATPITTVTGTDPDNSVFTFSIAGGADADIFTINSTTGALSFSTPPSNLTEQQDYVVQIQISDGNLTSTQLLTITVNDVPPVVTPPADLIVNASGLFTPVSLGTASATDISDGTLTATANKTGPFAPGTHTIIWSTTDSNSNSVQANQTLKVRPLANFARDQVVDDEGAPQITVHAYLNGTAADYPVTIPYTVGGTASNPDDHDLAAGSIVINSGKSGSVTFNVVDDGVGDDGETIILTMGTLNNAVIGTRNQHSVTLSELNEAPRVSLALDQGGLATNSIAVTGNGNIVATASVVDPNTGDSHSYDWANTSASLSDLDSTDSTFTFDPSSLTAGIYTLAVSVMDDASSPLFDSAVINLRIQTSAPVLSATADTDGDGIDDATEGYGDTDNDGVPDYLDAIAESNVLSQQRGNSSSFLMETNSGLRLRLGSAAIGTGNGASQISDTDIQAQTQSPLDTVTNVGGYFDFEVSDLPIAGQTIELVMAQTVQIPTNPVYRKLIAGNWSDFAENGTDSLASTEGSEGYCPPPGDISYTTGLTPGHWCVQVTLQDGGPNDADAAANHRIVDPGGVGSTGPAAETVTLQSSRGGGSLSLWVLTLFGLLVMRRRFRGVTARAAILVLLSVVTQSGHASELFAPNRFSLGAQWLSVDSGELQNHSSRLQGAGFDAQLISSNEDRNGWSAFLAYSLTENIQLELGYTDLGDTDLVLQGTVTDVGALLDAAANLEVNVPSADGATLVGRYNYPISENWALYGILGLFSWSSEIDITTNNQYRDIDDSGTDATYGLGIEHHLSKQFSIALGWQRYKINKEEADTIHLSLSYHIGQ